MNIMQVAILLIKITGLGWFLDDLLLVTYLPNDLLGLGHSQSGYYVAQYKLEIMTKSVRILMEFGFGLLFLTRADSVARWATKGLERFSSQIPPGQQAGTWPPAPHPGTEQPLTEPSEPVA